VNVSIDDYAEISWCTYRRLGITASVGTKEAMNLSAYSHLGGDLEVHLLAIAIGRETVVITGNGNEFTCAGRFLCHPPTALKMRGEIFFLLILQN